VFLPQNHTVSHSQSHKRWQGSAVRGWNDGRENKKYWDTPKFCSIGTSAINGVSLGVLWAALRAGAAYPHGFASA